MSEHSERAMYVTEQVALWIVNDGDYVDQARQLAREGGTHKLGDYLMRVVKSARKDSAPWHVAQELAPNDWGRIRWSDVVTELSD